MNADKIFDVAIAGGGLAGLCLAIQCADANFSVVLTEKEQYPFHKVCGEYISVESKGFLERLGVNIDNLDLPVIKKLRLSDVKGRCYDFNLPLGGFGISRFTLDNCLYEVAKAKGVNVCTQSKVNDIIYAGEAFTIATNQAFRAKIATGCFGKRSNLDVKWKRSFTLKKTSALNNYIGIKYHIRYEHEPDHIFLHNFSNGYCGMSRIEGGKSCLCYLTTAQNLRNSGNSIKEMERQILFRNPQLKDIFSQAEFLFDEPLTISQISFNKKSQVEEHVLMLGDAAGTITPLCGNGMSMAMHASRLAFQAISKFLRGGISQAQLENEYMTSWQKNFSLRLKTGRIVQRFFGGNISTSLFLKTMGAFPSLANKIIRLTHGNPF